MEPSKFEGRLPSKSVIFDLDGTLIDSQDSILNGISIALNQLTLEARIPISRALVGPPLIDIIERIVGTKDQTVINKVAYAFKLHYDSAGYIDSMPYPGVQHLLDSLLKQNYALYLATNKRQNPTNKILEHYSWRQFFSAVYCIDSGEQIPYKNKTEMISVLLRDQTIDPKLAVYVGDRIEDYEAAKSNGLKCILVSWGYGETIFSNNDGSLCNANNPLELQNIIQRLL